MIKGSTNLVLTGLVLAGLGTACVSGVEPTGPGETNQGGSAPNDDGNLSSSATGGAASSTTSGATMSTGIGGSSGPGSSGQGGGASGGAGPGPSSGSGGGVAGSLTAEYLASDTNANDSQMKPHFNLVNSGTDSVALTDVTIRYWFTKEAGAMQQEFWCDYALMNCTAINGDFGTWTAADADHYVELSFTSGDLAPGAETGVIQTRINMTDYANYDESDDYSWDSSKTTFEPWDHVTVYHFGTLVWGIEP